MKLRNLFGSHGCMNAYFIQKSCLLLYMEGNESESKYKVVVDAYFKAVLGDF